MRKRAVRESIAEHPSKRGGDLRDIWTVTCMDRAQRNVVNAGKWICIDRSVVNIDMVGWRTCYHAVQCFESFCDSALPALYLLAVRWQGGPVQLVDSVTPVHGVRGMVTTCLEPRVG